MSRKKKQPLATVSLAEGLAAREAELAKLAAKASQTPAMIINKRAKVGNGYPRASNSLGVHRTQRQEAMALDKKLGVPTQYTLDARPIFTDKGHQASWLKAHNQVRAKADRLVNHDGGHRDG